MGYTKEEVYEMQALMRYAADPNAEVEILAQIYGGSADDVCAALGIPPVPIEISRRMRREGWTEEKVSLARRMYREGKSKRKIAEATGLTVWKVDGFFRRRRGLFPEKRESSCACLGTKKPRAKEKAASDVSASLAAEGKI